MRVSPAGAAGSRLEILGHLIRLRRPDDTISVVNATISGYRATMLQRVRAQTLQRHRPGWVALFAGANDTPRYGTGASKPLVTGTETARILTEIRSQAAAAGARVIWMTPTACDTARIAACPSLSSSHVEVLDTVFRGSDDSDHRSASSTA